MNIGFDAKRALANNTGLGNYSRFVINGMAQYFPSESYYLFSPNIAPHPELVAPKATKIQLGNGLAGKWKRVFGMGDLLQSHQIDLYHGLSNELPLGNIKAKTVVSIHDLLFLRYPAFYPFVDRQIYAFKTKQACAKADLVLAISEQTKADLMQFLHVPEHKIKVHYQACHPQFLRTVLPEQLVKVSLKYGLDKPYLLQVGTLENRKNALLTLQAFERSRLKDSHLLVLVGNKTPYCETLYRFVDEKGLAGKVKFVHRSDFQDFPALYKGAVLSVYPSLFEGFGIPVLESMTVGTPVITSKGGCFHEVGGNAALYVDSSLADELRASMEEVASNPALRSDLSSKGLLQAERFSAERLIWELHQLYASL
jgi:glycosyltransferase involved in cell wall biosynthesis